MSVNLTRSSGLITFQPLQKQLMKYQKKGTQVLIGNATIPNRSTNDYIGTLCFSTQTETGTNEFVDIACSREQLEGLVVKLSRYLELCKEREAS